MDNEILFHQESENGKCYLILSGKNYFFANSTRYSAIQTLKR